MDILLAARNNPGKAWWVETLAPAEPWETAYPKVAEVVRAFLTQGEVKALETSRLVWCLTWAAFDDNLPEPVMKRLYQCLAALARYALQDCVTRAPAMPTKRKDKRTGQVVMKHPNIWHAPAPVKPEE